MPTSLHNLTSFPRDGIAAIFGATGGIGQAVAEEVAGTGHFSRTLRLARNELLPFDLLDEGSIVSACAVIAEAGPLRLVIDATGFLHDKHQKPERRLRDLTPEGLARAFAINATGPAMIMKHALPLLARDGKSVFATLSARVGSIGDNHLGGWYAYRASKAALNQLLVSASVELRRQRPGAVCLCLHPGTVDTHLSAPFAKAGLDVQAPEAAAARLLNVINRVGPQDSGSFLDQHGHIVPW